MPVLGIFHGQESEVYMSKTVKLLSMVLVIVLTISILIVPASAVSYTQIETVKDANMFSSEWEKTNTYRVGNTVIGHMIYGFDKDWIHEDYVWTKATQCYSTALVYRNYFDSSSYCSGKEAEKNVYSKIEVTHKTYYVFYRIDFSASYSNVTYTTVTSHVK